MSLGGAHLSLAYTPGWAENITAAVAGSSSPCDLCDVEPRAAILGAILFGGINAVQFRLQAGGTNIPAAFLNMMPYLVTILVLVAITWWEALSKRIGAPAALSKSYMREEK